MECELQSVSLKVNSGACQINRLQRFTCSRSISQKKHCYYVVLYPNPETGIPGTAKSTILSANIVNGARRIMKNVRFRKGFGFRCRRKNLRDLLIMDRDIG